MNQLKKFNPSILSNSGVRTEATLFVDEFIMHHPGDIIRVIGPGVRALVLVGDPI